MKKLVIALLVACGSPDNGELFSDINEPPGRIDYVSPRFWEKREIGTSRQRWVSAEYHGWQQDGEPCYHDAEGGPCRVPHLKQFSVFFDTSNCYANTVPLLKVNRMIQALKQGVLYWNGAGSGVTVEDGTCQWGSGNCHNVLITCTTPVPSDPGAIGAAGPVDANSSQRVSNLPVGPHGNDQTSGRVWLSSTMQFDPQEQWTTITTQCSQTGTNAQIDRFTQYTGVHEMGHVMGFGHFQDPNAVMYPYAGCAPDSTIDQEYKDAMSVFNSSGGAATVPDKNLERWSP